MIETADELSAPLGQTETRRKRRLRLPFTALQAVAVLLGLFLVAFAGFAIFGDNPLGGEPVARVAINEGAKPADDKAKAAAKTTDAIMKLPPAVTLAFTPYGSDPSKLAERARSQRHEILLQVPMEPYDYPDNDPGPQTLLATLGPDQNLDRLYWHMSRLQGYVGVANFMGARFVATENAMQPVVSEAAKRGLAFFDDGSAPRSVASSLATGQAMPFAKADVAIDAVPTALEIDHALAKLESLAKERGTAIGTASALPVSIERVGAWIKGLDAKGIMLVPLTTAMLKSKSS
jgi:polysaccharide deacetylase 2 family uncharacterized protein YibQ